MEQIQRQQSNIQTQQEYSVQEVLSQVRKVQEIMKSAMKDNEHFGVIPGTNKPTLLKPGAEKLCFTFRLGPEYEIIDHETDRRISYTVRCKLIHIPTGNFVAEGIGSCNSNEAKYRYRYIPSDRKPSKDEAATLKAQGLGKWRKDNGKWVWMERIEHDNPDDFENTIVKMACKRALVAATLNATAASDIFTQDVEDLPPEIINGDPIQEEQKTENGDKEELNKQIADIKQKSDEIKEKAIKQENGKPILDNQLKMLGMQWSQMQEQFAIEEDIIRKICQKKIGRDFESRKDLTFKEANTLIKWCGRAKAEEKPESDEFNEMLESIIESS